MSGLQHATLNNQLHFYKLAANFITRIFVTFFYFSGTYYHTTFMMITGNMKQITLNRSKFHIPAFIFILLLIAFPAHSQNLRINELMSSNNHSFYDEDGDTPDWIELYNGGTDAVNLSGYSLSDNIAFPFKWIFPDFVLGSGKFILLAASGKDRNTIPLYWETVISLNDTFRYNIPLTDPGAWRIPGFNDANWATGRSGFGYGDGDDSTVVPGGTITVLMRKSFMVSNLTAVKQLMLHVDFDDAFVAYLNGHEMARAQIGTNGIPPAWNTFAINGDHEAKLYQGGIPDAFPCDSAIKYLVPGNNLFAIEVHNSDTWSSDLSCIPFLTLGLSSEPEISRASSPSLKFGNSFFHLNFKINAAGDTVLLSNSAGIMIDSMYTGEIPADVSLGLKPDGISSRWFFSESTPGKTNSSKAFPVLSNTDPLFSHAGGFCADPLDLVISGAEISDSIWYTTDGSEPGRDDSLYSVPLHIAKSTVIRAIMLGPDRMNRRPVTRSYLFRSEQPTLTTISLSTAPPNFFQWDTGIYVLGPHASPDAPYFGANFWEDWERPIHIEIFEKDGSLGFETDAGVKIFGSWSRANPQRSLAFNAGSKYGAKMFGYKFFPELPFNKYNDFILRNSGNDWNNTMFRDAFMCSLLEQTNLDRMAYQPASVYLNGSYWGLLNIREKINEHFLATHHGIDPYQVDLLDGYGNPINGDAEHYNRMLNFLKANSPSVKTNYDQVKAMMNVENFMEYQLAQIYFNNTDWPGNNVKLWRPRTPEGRWRWIVYDTDFGFGCWDDDIRRYTYNTLAFALATDGPDWPNPPWSTFLLRRLLESQEFKNEFINRFADRLNTVFSYQHVLQHINQMRNTIAAEMPYHLARWNQWGENTDTWNGNVENMRLFANQRVWYMRNFINQQFGNHGFTTLKILISSPQSGTVKLNTLGLASFPWEGTYFKKVPVRLTARPNPGYRFVNWEGPVDNTLSLSTTLTISDFTTIKAVFKADGSGINDIVINEIYYNDPPDLNADDWVELCNKGTTTMDLTGWILKDEDDAHWFEIPSGIYMYPHEYLVLSRDASKFVVAYPDKNPPVGNFSFGLGSSGDCIRLYTADSILVDSVRYGVTDPWPSEPNETGTSLELINPVYDNSLAANWMASSATHGTPGQSNSLITGIKDIDSRPLSSHDMLFQSYPNPFSTVTTLLYEISEQEWTKITVYDMQGNLVGTLFEGETDPGIKEVSWDGCGSDGSKLASGVYVCRLETRNSTSHLRLVIVR